MKNMFAQHQFVNEQQNRRLSLRTRQTAAPVFKTNIYMSRERKDDIQQDAAGG